MKSIVPVSPDYVRILNQWNSLAEIRFNQIKSGLDITYRNFLMPNMIDLINPREGVSILDAGCGVGFLANEMSNRGAMVKGIDPSIVSINMASKNFSNIDFQCMSIEQLASLYSDKFDIISLNMVLMDALDINSFLSSCFMLLKSSGKIVFSITHPWFWSKYAGYSDESWFNYNKINIIEAPFVISNDKSGELVSTHVHRPLGCYLSSFVAHGFRWESITEPMPSANVMKLYKEEWKFPRYLFGVVVAP
ncbi:class I SAM-dependent methyltransferase [Xanthobacter autotrophicus]|uniref:class I SAM-dependent methyltransferase n=1 Tax=Xanthobacter autotrophicus TaxID=280 RepID=UPI003727B889